jgi:hypothetical protein
VSRQQEGTGVFGPEDDGVQAQYCTGVMAGLAVAASGHLLAIEIDNLDDFPGLVVEANGEHNWPTMPEVTGKVRVDGEEISIPELLMRPRPGSRYRVIFSASDLGVAPGVPDGTVVEVSLASLPSNFAVTIVDEHGNVVVGRL